MPHIHWKEESNMEPGKIQDPQFIADPPLPTFWGDIRHFFIGLPDRWNPDKRSAYVDRSADRPGSITEEEKLPTLCGFIGSFFGSSSVDDDYGSDKNVLGLGWPFSTDINGFSKLDDDD
jgi:hypothetical protein